MRKQGLIRFFILLFVVAPALTARATQAPRRTESGTFRLHKFLQPIGQETYEIGYYDDRVELKSSFEFTDRGTKVPLATSLRAATDLTPVHFEIKGNTSRGSTIDAAIDVHDGVATVVQDGASKTAKTPKVFYTAGGYAPVAMQMELVRYWLVHGRPASIETYPVGAVRITSRGDDVFEAGGTKRYLQLYSVEGLLWGREWLWLDTDTNLVGLVSIDAEFDHFEAVRDDYESALKHFVTRAAEDGMSQLAAFAKTLSPDDPGTFAITGATLVDATGAPPVPDSAVVVRGDRILAAGPRASVTIPKGARIVDGRGKWLMPGLWDMHAHFEQVEWGPIYLAAGVTTVRDCGNEFEFITAVRDAIAAGRGLGPRLLLAGIVDSDSPMAIGIDRINAPADVPVVVSRYKQAGFRQIKIYSSVKPELVPLICAEAHRQGLSVTGHIPNGMTATQGVEAGMDQINHVHFILGQIAPRPAGTSAADSAKLMAAVDFSSPDAQKIIRELADRHVVVDPTVALLEWFFHPKSTPFASIEPGAGKVPQALSGPINGAGASDERAADMKVLLDKLIELVGVLHRAGVPIVAGTDQAVPGHSLHREIELYVKAGFTTMEALQAATIVPARVMGLDKESGSIEAGKIADLLLLDADPLADIANTRKIAKVFAKGRVYDPAPLWRAAEFQP